MSDFVEAMIASVFCLLFLCLAATLGYFIVGTYNERQECVKLGIPLYRCSANSSKIDANVQLK